MMVCHYYLFSCDHEDHVKSLSLPGTYHEKISSLGTSLSAFTRLKSLDLSRNALISSGKYFPSSHHFLLNFAQDNLKTSAENLNSRTDQHQDFEDDVVKEAKT